ncbi:MAG TPA: single-stranded DNA-binding protein [Planctomycetota bacterium]|nr:single-stranded DNA-binding protein [Planctomycetota bacterium]
MANYNKVLLMGNITRDPELRYTPQGTAVCDLGIAVNREFGGGEGGDRRKETTFVDVTVWARRAEVICQYFKKGDPIFIEGRLTMESWENQEGQRRTKLKVTLESFEFLSSGRDRGDRGGEGRAPVEYHAGGSSSGRGPSEGSSSAWSDDPGPGIDDSEIPF